MTDEINPEIIDNSNPNTSAAFLGNPSVSPLQVQELAVKTLEAQQLKKEQERRQDAYRQSLWLNQIQEHITKAKDGLKDDTIQRLNDLQSMAGPAIASGLNIDVPYDNPPEQRAKANEIHNQLMNGFTKLSEDNTARNSIYDQYEKQAHSVPQDDPDAQKKYLDALVDINSSKTPQEFRDKFLTPPVLDKDGNRIGGGYGGMILQPKQPPPFKATNFVETTVAHAMKPYTKFDYDANNNMIGQSQVYSGDPRATTKLMFLGGQDPKSEGAKFIKQITPEFNGLDADKKNYYVFKSQQAGELGDPVEQYVKETYVDPLTQPVDRGSKPDMTVANYQKNAEYLNWKLANCSCRRR